MNHGVNLKRLHGFRFSLGDVAVLLLGAVASGILYNHGSPIWWIVAMVVGHFFLFCNVFRVRRSYEIAWGIAFIVNALLWLARSPVEWLGPCLTQMPITFVAIVAEMCSPRYHGIFANRINLHLPEYLEQRSRRNP